jgi:sugar phosphate isomerase/epimerase
MDAAGMTASAPDHSAPLPVVGREDLVMWNGTVRALSFADQVAATAAAGFGQLTVTPLDWAHWVSSGLGSKEMQAISNAHGVRLSHLDPLTRWTAPWQPINLDPAKYPISFFAFETDDFLRIAEAIGASSFSAIAPAPLGQVSIDQLTEDYANLCDRAASVGLVCELEFIPLDWAIPDLRAASRIILDAGRPNSGMVFDFWHFVRSGSTLAQLRDVPPGLITSVQLADATLEVPEGRARVDDCLLHRLPVGRGEFAVTEIVTTLAELGALSRVGPEYFSSELDAMSAEAIGSVCRRSVADYFSMTE